MSSMMDDASVSDGCLDEFIYIFSSFVFLFLLLFVFFTEKKIKKCQTYFFLAYGDVLYKYNIELSSHTYDTVPLLNRCDSMQLYRSRSERYLNHNMKIDENHVLVYGIPKIEHSPYD